jgi:uracil-DNA glycosylase
LNAYFTVRAGEPLSHARPEYDAFINDVMVYLDTLDQPMVFMLWGRFAKQYLPLIHQPKHIASPPPILRRWRPITAAGLATSFQPMQRLSRRKRPFAY